MPAGSAAYVKSADHRQATFEIEVCGDADASIARIFMAGEWHGDPEEARELIDAACSKLKERDRLDFLVLSGGFLCLPWPDWVKRWSIGDPVDPPEEVVEQLLEHGATEVKDLLGGTLRRRLRQVTRYVTLGVDTFYFMGSAWDPHAELTFAADLDTGRLWRTGKSYPNPRQQHGLVRVANLESHFVGAGGQKVMLLGCHDLNMFSPRSAHNARGWRAETIREFRGLTLAENPDLLLWHPHKSDTPRTWLAGLAGLKKLLPGIRYAGSGIYYNGTSEPRASIGQVLRGTKNTLTIDMIANRKNENGF